VSGDARDTVARLINDKYGLLIYKIAYEILQDEEAVKDIKQEVLLKCSMKSEVLEQLHENKFVAYICTAAKNTALSELRHRKAAARAQEKYIEAERDNLMMDHVDFKAFENEYGFSEEIAELLDDMNPMDKDILVMKYYDRFTNEQIAEELGTNVEHVKKRFQRAKKKLVHMIEERGVEL